MYELPGRILLAIYRGRLFCHVHYLCRGLVLDLIGDIILVSVPIMQYCH